MALEVRGKVSLDGSGFSRTLTGLKGQVGQFAGDLKSQLAGAFTVAAVGIYLAGLNKAVGRIKDLSEQFTVTTDEVQKLDFSLHQSGLSFDDLGTSLEKIGRQRREAVEGNEELRETFAKYGVTLAQLNDPQVRNIDILYALARALDGANITAREQVELSDLLGKKAGRMLSVLTELSQIEPPNFIKKSDIEAMDAINKSLEAMKMNFDAIAVSVLSGPMFALAARMENSPINRSIMGMAQNVGDIARKEVAGGFEEKKMRELVDDFRQVAFNAGSLEDITDAFEAFKRLVSLTKGERLPLPAAAPEGGMFEVDKNRKEGKEPRAAREPSFNLETAQAANSLAHIGGFVGTSGEQQETRRMMRETAKHVEAVARNVENIERAIAKAVEDQ